MTPVCVNPAGTVQTVPLHEALAVTRYIPRNLRPRGPAPDYDEKYYTRMSRDPEWMARKAREKRERRNNVRENDPELHHLLLKRDNAARLARKYQKKIDELKSSRGRKK